MVKVKNIHNTSKERYAESYPKQYKSWINYWEHKCPYSFLLDKCANENCNGRKEDGAHVIKEGSEKDRKWYIVPLCKKCNNPNNKSYFEVDEDYLVPVSEKNIEESDDFDDLLNELIDDDIF